MKTADIIIFTNGNQSATTTMSTNDADITDSDFADHIADYMRGSTLAVAALGALDWSSLMISLDGTTYERNR
jgi:hypothetical protein